MIPVNSLLLKGNEKKYLNECIDTNWISSEGLFVHKFEKKLANYLNRKYATACSSGSAAIDIAVRCLKLKKGDEVIMPTLTIISCAQSLVNNGIKPVFVDSDYYTFNMKIEDIESKITSKTKAIMMVHVYGLTVDVDPLLKIAKKYKLKVIEDAAEMIGQSYKNKKCGSFGDISILSFYSNKHITTGEGGMVLTNSRLLYERAKSLRNLCFTKNRFVHHEIGFNYRMTNIQAAIGLAQLEQIKKFIKKKKWIGKMYLNLLKDIDVINLPIKETKFCKNIYWVFAITLKDGFNKSAKSVMKKLNLNGVGTRPFFYPIHSQPVFKNKGLFKNERYLNATKLYKKGFYIPSGLGLTEEEIIKVSDIMHEVLG